MKILVTGANGFVGRAVGYRLEAKGHEVVPAVRRSMRRADIPVGDLGSATDWRGALMAGATGQKVATPAAVVIHLAARVHVSRREKVADPLTEYREVNTLGTLNLARQAAAAGVRRFVYLSSIKVNGEESLPGRPFTERDQPRPQGAYAVSKWEAEQGLRHIAAATGLEVVVIRPPLVYGQGVKANFLAMMRLLDSGVPLPLGMLHNRRSLVALDNLVDFIITCLDHPAAANQTFLIADGEDLSTSELLRRTAAALGRPARLLPVPQALLQAVLQVLGKGELARRLCGTLQADITKARTMLGWLPPVGVDDGLRAAARHLREHSR